MGKNALIAELVAGREAILQACWAHQLWSSSALRTADELPLRVLFPGWLNRGAGPDFTAARLLIGEDEVFGDVEIHVDESAWSAHGHHRDRAYDRVALHVVLRRSAAPGPPSPAGKNPPVFVALPFLSLRLGEVMDDPETMLRRYEELPGRCGLKAALAGPEALPRVIAHAAEARAWEKAERILPLWKDRPEEQILFELVFQSLGYRPHAEVFRALAARFPLASLGRFLALPQPEARSEVLSRWFGALGLLDGPIPKGSGQQEDYRNWQERWSGLGEPPLAERFKRGAARPWNSPERRMVGLFHHLYAMGVGGWLKGWLALLRDLDALRDRPELKKTALEKLERVFDSHPWEPWRRLVSFSHEPLQQSAALVGADRITIVVANAIIPFFLAYARRRGDAALEKLIYRLFIVLPPEAPNRKTRFMEKRLMPLGPMTRTLRMHQGLLQVYQDFCTSFYEGCLKCRFPDLIPGPPANATPPDATPPTRRGD